MKMNVYKIKTNNVLLIIGIFIGYVIGTCWWEYSFCSKNVEKCSVGEYGCTGDKALKHLDMDQDLVIAGVMTAKQYLTTRALASYNTWGQQVPGKVLYFSSEDSADGAPEDLPLVSLKGVTDTYPPQKKSFLMIKYLYDFYGDKYEWFIRADDDVYIRTDKLAQFLNSLNSSKENGMFHKSVNIFTGPYVLIVGGEATKDTLVPQLTSWVNFGSIYYIGQPGYGKANEEENLNMKGVDNYCMGGPGMILSRATMKMLVPRLSYCLKHQLYSTHEDVELGRCINITTKTLCTSSYEMAQLFFHNYAEPKGSFTQEVKKSHINLAITLHPIKNNKQQHKLHYYFESIKSQELRDRITHSEQELYNLDILLKAKSLEYRIANLSLTKSKFGVMVERSRDYLVSWQSIGSKFALYAPNALNPHQAIPNSYPVALVQMATHVKLQLYQKEFGFKRHMDIKLLRTRLKYGYKRTNPLIGADYILDVTFTWKINKRSHFKHMHLYLHQPFSEVEFREEICDSTPSNEHVITHKEVTLAEPLIKQEEPFRGPKCIEVFHFILPLSGRLNSFLRFLSNFENNVMKVELNLVLAIMFYDDISLQVNQINMYINRLRYEYPQHELKVIEMTGSFSRGKALEYGAKLFDQSCLLVFLDIDLNITTESLLRFRKNVIRGKQVYFPIFFSQFDPALACDETCQKSEQIFHNQLGYWRWSSYGQVVLYNSDFQAVGGFDKTIEGWGKEDLKLAEAFVKRNYTVFRGPEPGLVHIFHPILCDENLEPSQWKMCLGTKANTYASSDILVQLMAQYDIL